MHDEDRLIAKKTNGLVKVESLIELTNNLMSKKTNYLEELDKVRLVPYRRWDKWYVYDSKVKKIISPPFDSVKFIDYTFVTTKALIIVDDNQKMFVCSIVDEIKRPILYDKIDIVNAINKIMIVKKNDKFGLIDSSHNIIIPVIYDEIIDYNNHYGNNFSEISYLILKLNDKFGVFSSENNEILLIPSFDKISSVNNDVCCVVIDDKMRIYDLKNNCFVNNNYYDNNYWCYKYIDGLVFCYRNKIAIFVDGFGKEYIVGDLSNYRNVYRHGEYLLALKNGQKPGGSYRFVLYRMDKIISIFDNVYKSNFRVIDDMYLELFTSSDKYRVSTSRYYDFKGILVNSSIKNKLNEKDTEKRHIKYSVIRKNRMSIDDTSWEHSRDSNIYFDGKLILKRTGEDEGPIIHGFFKGLAYVDEVMSCDAECYGGIDIKEIGYININGECYWDNNL